MIALGAAILFAGLVFFRAIVFERSLCPVFSDTTGEERSLGPVFFVDGYLEDASILLLFFLPALVPLFCCRARVCGGGQKQKSSCAM
jgi:hypothetical protein